MFVCVSLYIAQIWVTAQSDLQMQWILKGQGYGYDVEYIHIYVHTCMYSKQIISCM